MENKFYQILKNDPSVIVFPSGFWNIPKFEVSDEDYKTFIMPPQEFLINDKGEYIKIEEKLK